jgi:N-acetylglucosaminyl-diphospho-decaprenol L-rhamnosyltransferase
MTNRLLVIILNYRVTDLTIDCLKSLAAEVPLIPGAKVAVCENGTGGDAETRLREAITVNGWESWVELTAVFPNRGFTGGNNIIIRQAMSWPDRPEYFLLLNADTLVHPGAFRALLRFMDSRPEVGIAGSMLEWPDGTPQGSPFWFPGITSELDRGLKLGIVTKLLSGSLVIDPKPVVPSPVGWVGGTSMIIRRQVIEAIGPLDEGLYTYFDDIDFCLNAKRAGWPTWFVPESRIIHLEGRSTGIKGDSPKRLPAYWFQARRRFFLKNHGPLYTALADAAFLAGFALWRVRRLIQGKPDTDPSHMLIDSLRHSVFMTGFTVREVENPALPVS